MKSIIRKILKEEYEPTETDWIPAGFGGHKTIPIKELPENILNFILRRLKPFCLKFID
jgi:hypothetical protein